MRGGLYKAAMAGDSGTVIGILEEELDPAKKRRAANHALGCAAWKGHLNTVRILCEWGADTDYQNLDGKTALMLAARWGWAEIVCQLLACGANSAVTDNEGKTAIDYAVLGKNEDVIAILNRASIAASLAAPGLPLAV